MLCYGINFLSGHVLGFTHEALDIVANISLRSVFVRPLNQPYQVRCYCIHCN